MKNFNGAIGEQHQQPNMCASMFSCHTGIRVPRSRFLPVKTTSDLLLVMSDLYKVKDGSLMMNPSRGFMSVPLVKLGDMNFRKVCIFYNNKLPLSWCVV